MISGAETEVKTTTFQNDMVTFRNKNDVMTLLIHLGYLAYDQKRQMAYIPNEEIRMEFMNAVEDDKWNELIEFETQSERLLEATLDMEEKVVAEYIDKIHNEYASTIQYHNENSLSSVLAIGYISAMKYYFKPVRETANRQEALLILYSFLNRNMSWIIRLWLLNLNGIKT